MVRSIRRAVAVLAGGAGLLVVAPAVAGATAVPAASRNFATSQRQLEQQLANRQSQLGRLTADVAHSKTLTSAHAATLNARLSAESASIDALASKVPGDSTPAQLATDRAAMLRDNRVYAVMTPQVIQTIEADAIAAQVSVLQGEQSSLQGSVASLQGQPGYRRALDRYDAFVHRVGVAASDTAAVAGQVLAQTPQGFPGNTGVFIHANRQLLAANLSLAYADYQASLVGLATGGSTGS